jgi:gliding motility-associated-like protein
LPLQDLVYCNGDATNLIQILGNANELNWSSSNPSIGTAAIGSGSIPSFNVLNPSQGPVSTVITVTPVNFFAGLTCMAPAEDFSITVNPTPTITPIGDQVLCAQSNSPAFLFSGNANSFIWSNSNNTIGLANSGAGNISSFVTQNNLPSVINANVSVTPQFTNAGLTCSGSPELFTIDVLPVPTLGALNPQVLCNGTATAPITFTGNATNYAWINNNVGIGLAAAGSGNIAGFNAVAGATNNVANLVVTPSYVYNNTTCQGTPSSTTITVLPSPFINTVQDVVTCNGDLSGILAFSGTANTFNWTNSNPSIGLVANGSGNLPVFTNTNTSSNPLLATITVTPQTGQGSQTCEGTPEIFTITVNPTPTMLPPGSQVLCSQTQTQPVNFSGNASSYSWLNSNTSIGLASFGNGSIPAFNAQNNGLNTQITQIQVTPQYVNAGTTCLGTPQNFTFSVDPIPTVQYSQISQTVCTGLGTTAVNLSSQTPGVVYSWNILNPSGAITGVTNMNGTGNLPSMTLVNSGNTSAQFNFQGIATTPLASCVGYGPLGTISVDPAPVMQPLNDLTICSNALINYNLVASIPSTFSWTASTNTNVVGQPTTAVNSNLIFNTLQNNASTLQYVTYTATPTSFPAGCVGQPETFIAEVVPNIQITSVANYEICSGEPTDITLVSNLPGNFTYTATNNPNVQGESSNTQPGFYINDILSNNTAFDQIVSYNVQVSSNPYGCFGLPQVVYVEVHPEMTITNVSPTQICSGAPLNLTLTATENATFSWYATQNGLITGESTTAQNTNVLNDNLSLIAGANIHDTVQYTISATSTVTGCDAQALPLSIIVNPVPVLTALLDTIFCAGETTDPYNWNGTANNYAWTNSNSSIGLALSGNGNIPAFVVNNSGQQSSISNINVVPQYVNNGFICSGAPDQFTITVEPIPSIAYNLPNQDLCSGDLSDTIAMSSPTSGAILTWQIINPPLAISGIPNLTGNDSIPGMYLSNSSTSAQQILFQGTVSTPLNGCTTLGPIGQIVVLPEPVVTTINDLTICSGDIVSQNINSSIPSTFVWGAQSNPNVNGESVGPVNSNFIYNSLQNTSSTIQYVNYTITPTSILGGCVGADLDFTVEVIPDITLNTVVTPLLDSICSGDLTDIFLQTNYPANIIWHALPNPNVSGETTTATAGAYISDILVNNTPFNQYVTYYIDMLSTPNACQGVPEIITVLVFPAIQLTNATNLNLCSRDTLDLNLAATVNATFTWYATNNGVVQGETTTPQNTSLINDILVNNSALTEQVYYAVDVVADNSGCLAFDLPITVNVLPLPMLLNNDTTICSGENTNINLVTNIPASIIWNGVFNIPIIGETYANISGTYINDLLINDSGQDDTLVYEVSATANGCTAPLDSVLVIVHDQPDVDFSVLTNPLCSEDNIQFTNLSSPNFDFDWSFGDGGTSVDYSPIHIYNNSGIYEVMLVGTNPLNNCSAADSTTIVVNKMPDASFYTMDTIGCGDLNATFYANYQATSDMVWDFGDGQTLAQVGNVTNYYGQAGCYDVTLTVTSPEGCVAQESYDDYVCVYENPIAFIGASPTSVNALNPTVQFSNASQNAISYIWQMGDGGISYDDNPTYTYPMEGADYHVTMTAYNEVGCFDTTSIDIHVYEELIFYVPNTFTPNDDEKNQTFYPVLSQGMKRTYMEFYIYNRWGELVFESHDPSYGWDGTYGPNALECPIGTYTWKLKLETLQTQEILDFHGHVNLIR